MQCGDPTTAYAVPLPFQGRQGIEHAAFGDICAVAMGRGLWAMGFKRCACASEQELKDRRDAGRL